MNIDKRREKIIERLNDKEHRDAFVSADIDVGISFQIRTIREQRGLTQQKLADLADKKQSWIAKLESPYGGFSLQTLKELASVFDVGLLVRFVPISELVKRELNLSTDSFEVPSFEEDLYFTPPLYTHVAQGSVIVGGEIVNFINPSQPVRTPKDEFTRYKEIKEAREKKERIQTELKNQMRKALMGAQL